MKNLAFGAALWAIALAPTVALGQAANAPAKPASDAASPAAPNAGAANPASPVIPASPPAAAANPAVPASPPAALASPANPATPANPPAAAANPASPANPPAAANPTGPIKPGSVRITTRVPDTDKWEAQRVVNTTQRLFKCKPLACADAETVTMVFSRSPTRHPDPQALDKLAKVDLPKSIRAADAAREVLTDGAEKIDTLTSKTTTLKSYPAVVNESKFTNSKQSIYVNTALIFAGPVLIRVQSISPNRDLAQKSLGEFVEVMKIEEGPPLQPGAPSPTMPTTSGKEEQL
jgi:hypothetical protein